MIWWTRPIRALLSKDLPSDQHFLRHRGVRSIEHECSITRIQILTNDGFQSQAIICSRTDYADDYLLPFGKALINWTEAAVLIPERTLIKLCAFLRKYPWRNAVACVKRRKRSIGSTWKRVAVPSMVSLRILSSRLRPHPADTISNA